MSVQLFFDPAQTLELALRLQPDARQVVVVTGASAFDRSWDALARKHVGHLTPIVSMIPYLPGSAACRAAAGANSLYCPRARS